MIATETRTTTTVCLAGPGSGKTRALVQEVKALIDQGHDPAGFVVISYTNSAADELAERIGTPLGFIGTLHAFMLKLLQRQSDTPLQVLSEEQAEVLLEEIIESHGYKGTRKDLDAALFLGPTILETGRHPSLAQIVAAAFFKTLKRQNLLTFDTLLDRGSAEAWIIDGYTHLFVDEYQDAADIDAAIYAALPIECKWFVADPDQAIFAFRGGNVQNALTAYSMADVRLTIERNHRCDRLIAEAAQRLIEHNENRIAKQTVSATGLHGLVTAKSYPSAGLEMAGVLDAVRQSEPEDCAVLVRTNREVKAWSEAISALGLPVRQRKPIDRPSDWRKATALLAVMADPCNDMTAYWAARIMFGKTADIMKRNALASNTPLASAIDPNLFGASIDDCLDRLAMHVSQPSIHMIRQTLSKGRPGTIADLCLRLAQTDNAEADYGAGVTVSTMHSAKGKEFDLVWLPGLTQANIPGKDRDIEEERRLLYVAMTRAKHELHLSCHRQAVDPWTRTNVVHDPSCFLEETGVRVLTMD